MLTIILFSMPSNQTEYYAATHSADRERERERERGRESEKIQVQMKNIYLKSAI